MKFTKLDDSIKERLCCPACGGTLQLSTGHAKCLVCTLGYLAKPVQTGDGQLEYVFDFRVPETCRSEADEDKKWQMVQRQYERFHRRCSERDDLESYLEEIDSVREIYEKEFLIYGDVLDMGGHQGRLRVFLEESGSLYLSIDPLLEVFQGIHEQRNLLAAYPCLCNPCNFLVCYGEKLPIVEKSFDWVHMRSVLDHFVNPSAALREAHRVLKPRGRLLVGASVTGKREPGDIHKIGKKGRRLTERLIRKARREGWFSFLPALKNKMMKLIGISNDHMVVWRYEDVVDLLARSGFEVVKEHRQKPPFESVLYLLALKKE